MRALITGASSGIGYSMAKYLSSIGYDLILVARDKEKLKRIKGELKTEVKVIVADLTDMSKIKEVYVLCKNDNIDMLVNNAGFGLFGDFLSTDLGKEFEMIDLNIKAVQALTKLFLKDMKKRESGIILNVASSAGFAPGPLMSTYYATKAYVKSFTCALYEELRRDKSNVHVSCLCPGPVKTNFNNVANVSFNMNGLDSDYVAKYAIDNALKHKLIIIPGFIIKMFIFFSRFASSKMVCKIIYNFQKKKDKKR